MSIKIPKEINILNNRLKEIRREEVALHMERNIIESELKMFKESGARGFVRKDSMANWDCYK